MHIYAYNYSSLKATVKTIVIIRLLGNLCGIIISLSYII